MLKVQAIKPNSHKPNKQNLQTNKNTQIAQNKDFFKSLSIGAFKSNAISFGQSKKAQNPEDEYSLDALDDIEDAMFNDEELVYEAMVNKYAQDAFMTLHDNKPVIMQYAFEDETPELFLENLELVVKHGRVAKLGFIKDKTQFLTFNMHDYEPEEKDPFVKVAKKITEFKQNNPKKKPILILRDFNALMKYQREPLKLLYNDVLMDNKTIALDKVKDDFDDDSFDFDYTKYPKVVKSFELTPLDSKDYEYLLDKPAFVKKHVSGGRALNINKAVIDKVIEVVEENGLDEWNYTPVNFLKDIIKYRMLKGRRPDRVAYKDVLECIDYYDLKKSTMFDYVAISDSKLKPLDGMPEKPEKPEKPESDGTTTTKDEGKAATTYDVIKNVKTRFKDVGGMFNVKEQIKEEFLDVIENPRVKLEDMPTGILLEGPPGTGKTLLAKAIAGESKLPFITIGGSDFDEMYVGVGAQRVRGLFKEARKLASEHPNKMALLFIDEAEGASGKRGNGGKEADKTLQAILKEMDGIKQKDDIKEKVIVVVATNRKDIMDPAFLRRFDIQATINDPSGSKKAREEIIAIHAKTLPFENDKEKTRILDNFADSSARMSGDGIAKTLKKAYRMTFNKNHKEDYITQADILEAQLRILVGIKSDSESADFVIESTIQHEAGHGLTSIIMNNVFRDENPRLKPLTEIDFITNEGRGNFGGAMYHKETEAQHWTFESMISQFVVSYGGGSVEKLILGGNAGGCRSDLKNVSNLANDAILRLGLGPNLGRKGFEEEDTQTPELFKKEIKKDFELMTDLSEGISDEIIKFSKGFIASYIKDFRENPQMRTEIITGDKFKSMFNDWIEKENKTEEYKTLCSDIYKKIKYAKETGELRQNKAGYINAINNPYQYNSSWTTSYS